MTTTTTPPVESRIVDVSPLQLQDWLTKDEAIVVDVREDFEHASEHIAGSTNRPLSKFDASALPKARPDQKVVLHCRSGKRSSQAAERLMREGASTAYQLAGGIEAWKGANLPVERSAKAPPIDVMRQVQIVAGSLVVLGVVLGAFVSPWFLILSGFVGAGLTVAGATGFCGMAKVLAHMPWNRLS